jgi:ABC-2 type transport system ATP-binding protein
LIVSTEQLTKTYGSTIALEAVDLAVAEHSVYGLVGLNGAGKTTLLSILAGLRRPSRGSVRLGVASSEWAMCPDTPVFESWLTADEVLHLSATLAGGSVSAARVASLLEEAGLAAVARRRVGGFSRGMTQRLAVAATMAANPRLVFLDEPCSALDPAGRVEVLDLVRRASDDATVVFSSHLLADVQRVCDTVGVLDGGRLVFQGPMSQLLERYARPAWRLAVRRGAAELATSLEQFDWVKRVVVLADQTVLVEAVSAERAEREISGVLAAEGVSLVAFEPEVPDLEAVFLQLTAGDGQPARTP